MYAGSKDGSRHTSGFVPAADRFNDISANIEPEGCLWDQVAPARILTHVLFQIKTMTCTCEPWVSGVERL